MERSEQRADTISNLIQHKKPSSNVKEIQHPAERLMPMTPPRLSQDLLPNSRPESYVPNHLLRVIHDHLTGGFSKTLGSI